MNYQISPTNIESGNFQRAYVVGHERDVFIDLDATSLEELNNKSNEVEQRLGELGVSHSKVTGDELISVSLMPDYNRDIHISLED